MQVHRLDVYPPICLALATSGPDSSHPGIIARFVLMNAFRRQRATCYSSDALHEPPPIFVVDPIIGTKQTRPEARRLRLSSSGIMLSHMTGGETAIRELPKRLMIGAE